MRSHCVSACCGHGSCCSECATRNRRTSHTSCAPLLAIAGRLLTQVDVTAGVPTVVLGLLQHMNAHNVNTSSLRRLVIGGAAPPRSMIEALET